MRRSRYRTAPDRIGWALAMGAAACGITAAFLGWGGGASLAGGIAIGLIGAIGGSIAIAGIGAPVWLGLKWRGPGVAAATGAAVTAVMTVAVLTRGFGVALPESDGATLGAIWASALATGTVAGFVGALLALAMWLVAYRER